MYFPLRECTILYGEAAQTGKLRIWQISLVLGFKSQKCSSYFEDSSYYYAPKLDEQSISTHFLDKSNVPESARVLVGALYREDYRCWDLRRTWVQIMTRVIVQLRCLKPTLMEVALSTKPKIFLQDTRADARLQFPRLRSFPVLAKIALALEEYSLSNLNT
ncbi:hypothetical protein K435DRAFT_793544 [Dendrothele bispora CBS 962.96]|uniref:Uncharacterized protein n=1 Tax=Dendrothele bispora (strain CBS 962.96) TaxID=1314807 RepID=A0A4S8MEZ3_DENBC|nr:hypothetical protein K435DRAFT_793544 [Dendrothele bispora CBS 962.96]